MRSSNTLKNLVKCLFFFAVAYQFYALLLSGSGKPVGEIETFLSVCSQWSVPVVLIDFEGLEHYQKAESDLEKNGMFATKRLWTFATWGTESLEKEGIFQELEGLGFQSVTLEDTTSSRPTAVFLRSQSVLIQIVIFHETEDNFWWHGSLELDFSWRAKLAVIGAEWSQLDIINDEESYDKFNTERVEINFQVVLIPKNIKKFLERSAQHKFIECNVETAKRFVQQYGKNDSQNVQEFVRKSRNLLATAKDILDTLKVPFWLQSGTLLGYLRECDIISYTTDVDIGFYAKDYKPGILLEFERSKFTVKFIDGRVNDSFVLSLKRDGVKLDLFAFYEEEDSVWMGHSSGSGQKYRYVYPKISLCWTEFLGMKVRVPCNVQEVIEVEYGKDWFTPKKDWNYLTGSQNKVKEGKWPDDQNPHETYKSYLEVLRKQGQ